MRPSFKNQSRKHLGNDSTPGSNMHGLKSGSCRFWQRTDLPPGSNMLRRAAQTCSACKLAGAQIIPLPTLANQILARTFSDSVSHLFAYPAAGKFSRASSAGGRLNLRSNIEQPDRVGRRGLSEPRENFSRLNTYAWTQKWFVQFFGSGLICPRTQTCCAELRRLARLANSPGFKSFHCPRWRIKFSLERFQIPSRICLRIQPLESSLGRVPQAAD